MIQLKRKEAQRESTKLCRLSGVFWNERRCFVQSHDVEIRMLSVCIVREEKRKEV
jgi:hypothetical protein